MNIVIMTHPGLEASAKKEVGELLGIPCSGGNGWVSFDGALDDAVRYAYRGQSQSKILVGAGVAARGLSGICKDLERACSAVAWDAVLHSSMSFAAVACKWVDAPEPSSVIAAQLGYHVKETTGAGVHLASPDAVVCAVVTADAVIVGRQIGPSDAGKRPYRVFSAGEALKAPLAYALVRESGWSSSMQFLDPCCRAGTIAIEAALFGAGQSCQRFTRESILSTTAGLLEVSDVQSLLDQVDQGLVPVSGCIQAFDNSFHAVSAAKKNAKIAGVEKWIGFRKKDMDWIDASIDPCSVDVIASYPPLPGRFLPVERLRRVYQTLLRQAAKVMKKSAAMSLLVQDTGLWEGLCAQEGFCVKSRVRVMQGKQPFWMLTVVA